MKRTALVTGASRGIGKAIALRLARGGAAVAVNYRERADDAGAVVNQIRAAGGHAEAFQADVAVKEQCAGLAARVEASLGPVDILVNNAGVLRRGDLSDFDFSEMEPMRAVNVDGLVRVTKAIAPGMQARGWGRIINLTSIAAFGTHMRGTTFYAATKAAVILLTRRFALELGQHGITVNAIAPGFILTDMVGQAAPEAERAQIVERMAGLAMMRRTGAPDDVAAAAAFLASDEASFITAQVLTVDGGRTDYISHI